MTRKTFNTGMALMLNAWTYAQDRTTPETEGVYWHELKNIPDDKFMAAIHQCLAECHFFPVVADIVERAYPRYERKGPYNPYGSGKLVTVTPFQQLETVNRQILLEGKK